MATPKYQKSQSGYYKVDLLKSHEVGRFHYKPGGGITVNETVLEDMIAAGKVANVVAAD